MNSKQTALQASVLDRLINLDPRASREPVQYRLLSVQELKRAVIRDLENLLNTRRTLVEAPAGFVELARSLYTYGIKDITSYSPVSPSGRRELRMEVERVIRMFEPRLRHVLVQMDTALESRRHIRFRISAVLVVEPVKEPITFDTYLDISRGNYKVSG